MDTLDLNIDIYTVDELLNIFSIKKNYTTQDVISSKNKLSEQLKKINSLGNEKKREIQFFIDTASSKLINIQTQKKETQQRELTYTQPKNDVIFSGSHPIIENSNELVGRNALRAGGRSAGSADMQPGYINPINVRTVTQGINIDTRFRDKYYSTSSSNFVLHLPEIQKRVVTLRIATIEIPMTFYAISRQRGNATFVIQGDNSYNDIDLNTEQTVILQTNLNTSEASRTVTLPGGGRKAWLVVLPDGNYELDWQGQTNASSIVVAMNNAIALAVPGYISPDGRFGAYPGSTDYLNPSQDIAFNVDRVSGRAIFARPSTANPLEENPKLGTGPVRINFAVDYGGNLSVEENLQLRLGWELGFRMGHYEGNNIDGFSIVSEGICMITGPRYAYISLNDGQKSTGSSFIAAYANSSLDKNIITRINVAAVADDVGIYKVSSDAGLSNQLNRTREYFGPVDIERLEIKLFDEYGRILELNNMDWSMTLVFEKLYD